MARGLTRDVRQAQEQLQQDEALVPPAAHRPVAKEPIRNVANTAGDLNHDSRAAKKTSRSRVQLPDVTGLTNAVNSPAKGNLERYGVRGQGSTEVEGNSINLLFREEKLIAR